MGGRKEAPITAKRVYYIKGRFLTQDATGVQRFAYEVLNALDKRLEDPSFLPDTKFVVLTPAPVPRAPGWRHIEVRTGTLGLQGHLWEQIELPLLARGGTLVTLSGMPSLLKLHQVTVLHDAGVFDIPHSYARSFRIWYRFGYKTAASRGHQLFTVSEFSRSRLCDVLGVSSDKFAIASCGADHICRIDEDRRIFERFPHLLSERFVLSVGSHAPHKNFAMIDRLAARYPTTGVRFVVVGGSGAKPFPGTQCDRTSFLALGRVSDGELKALYRNATCFVFPSVYEGFGIPALEAMLMECPVVASNRSSLPEICGDAAVFFDPESVDDLQRALDSVLSCEATREKLRAAGLQRAQDFTWDRTLQALLQPVRRAT
jgi:glycosyltransferase involved in cell wall biosynthesis